VLAVQRYKLEFHDTDTDTDILARILADMSDMRDFLKLFLWQAVRQADILATIEDVGVHVGVGVVEYQLHVYTADESITLPLGTPHLRQVQCQFLRTLRTLRRLHYSVDLHIRAYIYGTGSITIWTSLAVASTARDDPSTLPGDDPFPRG